MLGRKMTEGQARIIAYEGVTSGNSTTDLHGNVWIHEKYIVEVQPEGGPAFRAEVKARVPFSHSPNTGDLVSVRYDASSRKVELQLDGDPRYDPKLRRAAEKAKRDELLHGTPGTGPASAAGTGLDPELQELMDLEEAERRAATSAAPATSGSASRMDRLQQLGDLRAQGLLTEIEFQQEKTRILNEP